MTDLSINIHNSHKISIMDLSRDLNINDLKWDGLINYLVENSEATYFYSLRLNYFNAELKKNIEYLSEQNLFNEEEEFNRILFRVKSANLILNRNLLSEIWKAYESPCLIFLKNGDNQTSIKSILFEQIYYPKLLQNVEGVTLIYQGMENNVLWLLSNENISNISELYD